MFLKKYILLIICLTLFLHAAKATTYKTAHNGNWLIASTWQGGVAPPSSTSDTFLIEHNININSNLTFNSNALLYVDSAGGLCGHYTVTVNTGAKIIKYGTLNFDVINIPGGLVNCYKPGAVIITQYGVLSNGGQLNTFGCSFVVGPWFTCQFPSDNAIQTFVTSPFNVYPNPAQNKITIDATNLVETKLFDVLGKQITSTKANEIDVSNLTDGVYFVQVKTNQNTSTQKIMVQH